MIETKHAPGPWHLNERFDVIADLSGGWNGIIICSLVEARFCDPPSVALHKDVVVANGRLIAAAPDLLAACKLAHVALLTGDGEVEAIKACGKATTKAEPEKT